MMCPGSLLFTDGVAEYPIFKPLREGGKRFCRPFIICLLLPQ